jgi:hypothetical protein
MNTQACETVNRYAKSITHNFILPTIKFLNRIFRYLNLGTFGIQIQEYIYDKEFTLLRSLSSCASKLSLSDCSSRTSV